MKLEFLLALLLLAGCSNLNKKYSYHLRENVVWQKNRALAFDVYQPEGLDKVPIVLVLHGGAWTKRSGDMTSICKDLAQQGFLAVNITYRLAPEDIYPAALDDVNLTLGYIRTHAPEFNGDGDRIFAWGYSAGAHLALLLGFNPQNGIKGIVAGAAPSDFAAYPNSPLISRFLGKKYSEDPNLWAEASPINHVTAQAPPVFLYHGKSDILVSIDQSRSLKTKLEANHVSVTLKEVGWGMGHITLYLFSQSSVDAGIEFLQRLANMAKN